jgi:hypothetical protein
MIKKRSQGAAKKNHEQQMEVGIFLFVTGAFLLLVVVAMWAMIDDLFIVRTTRTPEPTNISQEHFEEEIELLDISPRERELQLSYEEIFSL